MSASELSEHPFGHKVCDVPGHEHVWVRFKTSGYPRKLRREWDSSHDAGAVWAIVMRYVVAWHVTDLDGAPVEIPVAPPDTPDDKRNEALLMAVDNVEDSVVSWIIRAFTAFWLGELVAPRKNS